MSPEDQLADALASAQATVDKLLAFPPITASDEESPDLVAVNAALDAREGQIVIVLEAASDPDLTLDELRTRIINVLGPQP